MLPLIDELSCRCATFIANALDSDSDVVSYVARHGVYYGRMLSPIGGNAYFCCSRYGALLYDIAFITKDFVRSHVPHAHLVMPFLLCTVYLICFMSDTDTLLLDFLHVMSLCMLFVICQQ